MMEREINIVDLLNELDEMRERVEKKSLSHSDEIRLKNIHLDVFKSNIKVTCKNRYLDAYLLIRRELKRLISDGVKTINEREKMKFKVANGVLVLLENGDYFTSRTQTDEKSIMALAYDPRQINNFDNFPDNWKELVDEFKKGEDGLLLSGDVTFENVSKFIKKEKDKGLNIDEVKQLLSGVTKISGKGGKIYIPKTIEEIYSK